MRNHRKLFMKQQGGMSGFTLIELAVAMAIILIVAGIVIPNLSTAMRGFRLKGGATDFAGLLQAARIKAVDDDRFYSVYVRAANGNNPEVGFVDIYPQNPNGTSGSGGAVQDPKDPLIQIPAEVIQLGQGAAPNTLNLRGQILPPTSPVVMQDGSAAGTPITFSPRGLPCTPMLAAGGTVCDSLGGPTAYWTFFQNTLTQNWCAVTVTPAGRIQRWIFTGGAAGIWTPF